MSVQEVGRIELRLNDACVLTNVGSGTTEQNRGFVEHGKLPLFVKVIRSSKDDVQEQTAGAMGNISSELPNFRDLLLVHP